jgi:Calx-beta domain
MRRFLVSVSLLIPLIASVPTGDAEDTPSAPKPVQEYVYAGSRLLAIVPPSERSRRRLGYKLVIPGTPVVVSEGEPLVKVPIKLVDTLGSLGPTGAEIWVEYVTVAGSAEALHDFKPTYGVRVFPVGSTSGATLEIPVALLPDEDPEPDERFEVRFSNPVGAMLSATSQTVVIADDDNSTPPTSVTSGGPQ